MIHQKLLKGFVFGLANSGYIHAGTILENRLFSNVIILSNKLEHQPYSYSKTLAEKEAWKINEKQTRWDLVTINPTLVIGPGINPHATSESFKLVKQFGDGSLKAGAPRLGFGVVDVRDLAEAHFKAAFTPEAKGRYIISGHNTDFPSLAETLIDKFGNDYPIPRKVMPKWLVWLVDDSQNI